MYCNNIINNKDSKILFYLNQLELNKNILNKYPHELSGGQKQRVCIVRILLTDPEIIIFDESVSALDMNTQAHVLNLIKKIYYKNNISIIYISHDISTVSFLCNKIYVLNKGTIIDSFIKENILSDKRHSDIKKLSENNTKRRLFANWAMRGDPLITSMWNNKDVMEGTVKKLNSAEAFKIFETVSREIDQFN